MAGAAWLCAVLALAAPAAPDGPSAPGGPTTEGTRPCWCGARVALLISGQAARYPWRETFARLSGGAPALLRGEGGACGPAGFDAFVALSQRANVSYHTRRDALRGRIVPADLNRGTPEVTRAQTLPAIEAFLRRAGGGVARAALFDEAQTDAIMRRARAAVAALGAEALFTTPDRWWAGARKSILDFDDKWARNGRMFLLRHAAFRMALDEGRAYAWFLYSRDDNVFLDPPGELAAFAARACAARREAARSAWAGVVAVDKGCGFGAYADKVYLADEAGAAALFGRTFEDHARAMHGWVTLALLPEASPARLRPPVRLIRGQVAPLQTEYFLRVLLESHGVVVTRIYFRRADVRAVHPIPPGVPREVAARQEDACALLCVPYVYAHCVSKSARLADLTECQRLNRVVSKAQHREARGTLGLGMNASGAGERPWTWYLAVSAALAGRRVCAEAPVVDPADLPAAPRDFSRQSHGETAAADGL